MDTFFIDIHGSGESNVHVIGIMISSKKISTYFCIMYDPSNEIK